MWWLRYIFKEKQKLITGSGGICGKRNSVNISGQRPALWINQNKQYLGRQHYPESQVDQPHNIPWLQEQVRSWIPWHEWLTSWHSKAISPFRRHKQECDEKLSWMSTVPITHKTFNSTNKKAAGTWESHHLQVLFSVTIPFWPGNVSPCPFSLLPLDTDNPLQPHGERAFPRRTAAVQKGGGTSPLSQEQQGLSVLVQSVKPMDWK